MTITQRIITTASLLLASAGVAAAADPKPLFGAADWLPSETDPVGFAGQGNNWYPGANPPAEFWEGTPTKIKVMHEKNTRMDGYISLSGPYNQELLVPGYADSKSKNILWKVPTPGWSTSSPIVIGKRVITLHSPHYVVCRDTDTGKVLWQDELKVMLLPKLSADRTSLDPVPANAQDLQFLHEFDLAVYRLDFACHPGLHKGIFKGDERKPQIALMGEVIEGLGQNKAALVKAFPASGAVIDAHIAVYRALMAISDEDMKNRDIRSKLDKSLGEFTRWAEKQTGVPVNNAWPGCWISDTISTPVSDGKIVGVQFGHGQTAAYELETGKRLWAFRDPTMVATTVSHAVSPLLWKDLLIFNSGGAPKRMPTLLALDKRTGAVRWETNTGQKNMPVGGSHGDHMPHYLARLPGKVVIVSNAGAVVDAETGKTLIEKLPSPETKGDWGSGYLCGIGNLIFKSHGSKLTLESWELKVATDGKLEAVARPTIPFTSSQWPFALSDQVMQISGKAGGLLDPFTGKVLEPFNGKVLGIMPKATPTIAGKTLILAQEEVNPSGRQRQDRMNLCRFGTFDISDPAKPKLLSAKSLLGTASFPVDIADTYFPAIAKNPDLKALTLGAYHGVAPGFGVYMAGVTAHGNRLFILSQSHLYCIGEKQTQIVKP